METFNFPIIPRDFLVNRPFEMPIAPHQVVQISRVCNQSLTLNPNNDPRLVASCQTFGWRLPSLTINVDEFITFFEERLRVECWGGGEAFAPSAGAYQEIGLNFFLIHFPQQYQIEELYLSYIRFLLTNHPAQHYPNWLLKAAYIFPMDFSESNKMTIALRTSTPLSVTIYGQNTFYSVSAWDGTFVSVKRNVMCFSLGALFADTMETAQKALEDHYNRLVTNVELRGRINLFFPLMYAKLRGCLVDFSISFFALNTLWECAPNERRVNLIPHRIKQHQLKIRHIKGKVIDFLNQLGVIKHRRSLCSLFAKGWLKYSNQLGFDHQNDFARLVERCPEITLLLDSYIKTLFLFLCAEGKMEACREIPLPPGIPKNRTQVHASIICKVEEHEYHLALSNRNFSPMHVCLEGAKAYHPLFELIQKHGSTDLLLGLLNCFDISHEYLKKDIFFGKITQIFTEKPIQEMCNRVYYQYKPQRLRDVIHALVSDKPEAHEKIDIDLAFFALDDMVTVSKRFTPFVTFTDLLKRFLHDGAEPDPQVFKIMVTTPEVLIQDAEFNSFGITQYFLDTLNKLMPCVIRNPKWNKDQVFGLYQMMSKLQILSENEEQMVILALLPHLDTLSVDESRKLTKEALERGLLKAPCLKAFERLITSNNKDDLICAHRHFDILFEHGKASHELVLRLIASSVRQLDQWSFATLLKFAKRLDKNDIAQFPFHFVRDVSLGVKNAKHQTKNDAFQIIDILNLLLDCKLENEAIGNIVATIEGLMVKPPKILVELAPVIEKLAALKLDLPTQIRSEFINISLRLAAFKPHHNSVEFTKSSSLLKSMWTAYMGVNMYELVLKRIFKRMSDTLAKMTNRINRATRQFKAYAKLAAEITDNELKNIFRRFAIRGDMDVESIREQFSAATRQAFPDIDISSIPKETRRREQREEKKEAPPVTVAVPKETFDGSEDFSKGIEAIRNLGDMVTTAPQLQDTNSTLFQYVLLSLKKRTVFPDATPQLVMTTIATLIRSQRKLYMRYAEDLFELAMKNHFLTDDQKQAICKEFMQGYVLLSNKFKSTDWSDEILLSFERWNIGEKEEDVSLAMEAIINIQSGDQKGVLTAAEFLTNVLKRNPADPAIRTKIVQSYIALLNICQNEDEETWSKQLMQSMLKQLFSIDWIGDYYNDLMVFIFNFTQHGDEASTEELFWILSAKRFFIHFDEARYTTLIDILHSKNKSTLLPYLLPFIRDAFLGEEEKGNVIVRLNRKAAASVLLHFIVTTAKMIDSSDDLFRDCSQLLEQYHDIFKTHDSLFEEAVVHIYCRVKSPDKIKLALETLLKRPLKKEKAIRVFVRAVKSIEDQYNPELAKLFQALAKTVFYSKENEPSLFRLVSSLYNSKVKTIRSAGEEIFIDYIKYLKANNESFCTTDFANALIAAVKGFGKMKSLLDMRQCLKNENVSLKDFEVELEFEIQAQHEQLTKRSMKDINEAREVYIHLKWMLDFYALSYPELGQKTILGILDKFKAFKPGLKALRVFETIMNEARDKGIFDQKRRGICKTEKIASNVTLSLATTKSVIEFMELLVDAVTVDELKSVCDSFLEYEEYFNTAEHKDTMAVVGGIFLKLSTCVILNACATGNLDILEDLMHDYLEGRLEKLFKKSRFSLVEGAFATARIPLLSHLAHRLCYVIPMMYKIKKLGLYDIMKKGTQEKRIDLLRKLLNTKPFSDCQLYSQHLKNGYFLGHSNNLDLVLHDIAKAIDMCKTQQHFNRLTSFDSLNPTIGLFLRFSTKYVNYYDSFFSAYKQKRCKGLELSGFDLVEKAWAVDKIIPFKLFFSIVYPLVPVNEMLSFLKFFKDKRNSVGISDFDIDRLDYPLLSREGKEPETKAAANAAANAMVSSRLLALEQKLQGPQFVLGGNIFQSLLGANVVNEIDKLLANGLGEEGAGPGAGASAPAEGGSKKKKKKRR